MTFNPTWTQALNAIEARRNGVFDDPDLMAFGPLLPDVEADVLAIKTAALTAYDFSVGARDARLNTKYPGAFMVAEAHDESELPTEDGANGPWCIVGDDLGALVSEAFDVWADVCAEPG